ncbi:MAG: RidA family protein [Methanomassiliicoccales archaeon]|nr:RidA family protein [Methanomassiliicoccales archaeon]
MHKIIFTEHAPRPVGPYSQAVVMGNMLFCSGQIGLDPATGKLVPGNVAEETDQCLRNLSKVLEAGGSALSKVIKTTVFVTDLAHFKEVNEAYASFFPESPPARSAVQVSALPLSARVEIEAIAFLSGD